MRLLYFFEDLLIAISLTTAILAGTLAFNPPTPAQMSYCEEVNGDGFDYGACVIDSAI